MITRFESSLGTMSANSDAEQKETAAVLDIIAERKRIETGGRRRIAIPAIKVSKLLLLLSNGLYASSLLNRI